MSGYTVEAVAALLALVTEDLAAKAFENAATLLETAESRLLDLIAEEGQEGMSTNELQSDLARVKDLQPKIYSLIALRDQDNN